MIFSKISCKNVYGKSPMQLLYHTVTHLTYSFNILCCQRDLRINTTTEYKINTSN